MPSTFDPLAAPPDPSAPAASAACNFKACVRRSSPPDRPFHAGVWRWLLLCCWCALACLGLAGLVLGAPPLAQADIYVIAHPAAPIKSMTRQQVLDLYLGRAQAPTPPSFTEILDLPKGAAKREQFFLSLAAASGASVDDYWARLAYVGGLAPLKTMPDEAAVLDKVRRSTGAIGYVQSVPADGSVQTLLRLPLVAP